MKINIVTDTNTPDLNGVFMTRSHLTDGLETGGHGSRGIRGGGKETAQLVRGILPNAASWIAGP